MVDADDRGGDRRGDGRGAEPEDVARKLFALGARVYERGKYGHAYAFFTRARRARRRARADLLACPGAAASSAAVARRRSRSTRQYLATDNPTRKADAESALAELKSDSTGDEATDIATAQGPLHQGRRAVRAGDYAHAYDEFTKAGELADRARAAVLARPGAAEARRPPRGGDRALRAVPRPRRRRRARPTPSPRSPSCARRVDRRRDQGHRDRQGASSTRAPRSYEAGRLRHAYDEFTKAGELADRPALLFSRAQSLRSSAVARPRRSALYQAVHRLRRGRRARGRQADARAAPTHGAAP